MKVSIQLEYKDKVYTSDVLEIPEEEKNQFNQLIQGLTEETITHFSFKKQNHEHYFGKKVLEESIVTIIHLT